MTWKMLKSNYIKKHSLSCDEGRHRTDGETACFVKSHHTTNEGAIELA